MSENFEGRFRDLFQELVTKEQGLKNRVSILESLISKNNLYFLAFDTEEKIVCHNLPNRSDLNCLSDVEYILQKDIIVQIRRYMTAPFPKDPFEITLKGTALEFILFTNENCEGIFFLQIAFFKNQHTITQNAGDEQAYSQAETSVNNLHLALNILEEIKNIESVLEKQHLYQEIQNHYLPALEQLQLNINDPIIRVCLEIIHNNLNDIISPSAGISSLYKILTPSEIRVAEFIRMGKSSQDIADALDIARKTVENHRNSLRDKLGLKNKGVNLRSYLLDLGNG
ncbi:MAG: LuxR C-terminal-related transcriptional regulator [Treponema sp.]|jgi:DNA-binding CsgD family transcriptional regulator|nr:LuxR C-terminal-related transcriptional regulator [Treponema sp.]